jgi:hypothetical protein
MGGKADKRVRVRVFSYLRQAGIDVSQANRAASKVVGAMVGSGKLPECVVTLAGAAVTADPKLDGMNERDAVLVEPKAEPYEVGGGSLAKGPQPGMIGGKSLAKGPVPGRIGGRGSLRPGAEIGGLDSERGAKSMRGGYKTPAGNQGSTTNFAIIEPIMERREVQGMMGTVLSRGQIQTLVGEVMRTVRDF